MFRFNWKIIIYFCLALSFCIFIWTDTQQLQEYLGPHYKELVDFLTPYYKKLVELISPYYKELVEWVSPYYKELIELISPYIPECPCEFLTWKGLIIYTGLILWLLSYPFLALKDFFERCPPISDRTFVIIMTAIAAIVVILG